MASFADIDRGKAGSLIRTLLSDEANNEKWLKYKILTEDFCDDSPELKPFDPDQLDRVVIPPDWERIQREKKRQSERAFRESHRKMWDHLNRAQDYWAPWLTMEDMDAIVAKANLQELFGRGDLPEFTKRFLEELQSYSWEIADRERRHRR
ncbi:MAG: hypothetical protein FJ388_05095 [Verrucomicrobia bacterium]|nr:hypothetical protein [Verrucomicrobiota bacterium]